MEEETHEGKNVGGSRKSQNGPDRTGTLHLALTVTCYVNLDKLLKILLFCTRKNGKKIFSTHSFPRGFTKIKEITLKVPKYFRRKAYMIGRTISAVDNKYPSQVSLDKKRMYWLS